MSQKPRVKRNHESSLFVLPRRVERNAPVPARKTKVGAQKCVIQRVKKRPVQVCVGSSGSNAFAYAWKKSRTWSSAMMTITMPRTASTELSRARGSRRSPSRFVVPSRASTPVVTCDINSPPREIKQTLRGATLRRERGQTLQVEVAAAEGL